MKKLLLAIASMFALAVPSYGAGVMVYDNDASGGANTLKGTANQVYGMNSAATVAEMKTVAGLGTAEVAHAANAITVTGRQTFHVQLTPTTGAAADDTTYRALVFPGRAGVVKKVTLGALVKPVGSGTIKVLEANASGNTMLSAASVDATTLVSEVATAAGLSATLADRTLTAAQGVYVEYDADTQSTDAQGVSVTLEFAPTDAN